MRDDGDGADFTTQAGVVLEGTVPASAKADYGCSEPKVVRGLFDRFMIAREDCPMELVELNTFDKAEKTSYLRRVAERLKHMFMTPRGLTIDSGAAEHVIPEGWVKSVEVKPCPGSMRSAIRGRQRSQDQ